jgi:hypothetical protein
VGLLQPLDHRPPHAVEHQRQVVDDKQHPRPAVGEHERARPQAGVQPGRLLVGAAVAHQPDVGGLTGDVRDAPTDVHPRTVAERRALGNGRCPVPTGAPASTLTGS